MNKHYNLKTVEKIMQYQSYAEKLSTFAEYLIFKLTHKKQRVMCIECISTTNDIITYTVETHYNEYVITINTQNMKGYAEFTDNTVLITSAIHDMRAAFNNLCDIISAANGIDDCNSEMLSALVANINDYIKSFD